MNRLNKNPNIASVETFFLLMSYIMIPYERPILSRSYLDRLHHPITAFSYLLDFGGCQGAGKVLLVGEDQQGRPEETLQ